MSKPSEKAMVRARMLAPELHQGWSVLNSDHEMTALDIARAIDEAVTEEREACAVVAEECRHCHGAGFVLVAYGPNQEGECCRCEPRDGLEAAEFIRARGKETPADGQGVAQADKGAAQT